MDWTISKRRMSIEGRTISFLDPTFIIAEIGINHNGKLDIAKKLIDNAIECGANAVKFQSFKTEGLLSQPNPKMTDEEIKEKKDLFNAIKEVELTEEMHYKIDEYCRKKKILFFSTAGDIDSFLLLKELDVPLIKISSNDINNFPLLREVAKSKIPVIFSTGMSYLSEVDEAVRIFENAGNRNLGILHCTSNYPPIAQNLNLNNIITLNRIYEYPIGFSDHTMELHYSVAAVAMGACIIERHFTLDHDMEGFDHKSSLDQLQFKTLVNYIRDIEISKGSFRKNPASSEFSSKDIMRRSLVARVEIPENTIITKEMIELKRPGTGLSAKFLDFIIGRTSKSHIYKDELILLENLK